MDKQADLMLIELKDQGERVRELFTGAHLRLVIDAVIAGNSPGRLWVDDPAQPRRVLLWDTTHSFYLAGAADDPAFNAALSAFFADKVTPDAQARRLGIFKLAYADPAWQPVVQRQLAAYDLHHYERVFFRLAAPKTPVWNAALPAGFAINEITASWSALERLANFERLHAEIASCWPEVATFRARGFGCCIHDAQTIAGWCTAEYVSAGQCGIGIETVEAYSRRGFATLTASAFVAECAARGLTPHWDSWRRNTPSVRVAEKVGFTKLVDYAVYFGTYPPG